MLGMPHSFKFHSPLIAMLAVLFGLAGYVLAFGVFVFRLAGILHGRGIGAYGGDDFRAGTKPVFGRAR